MQMADMQITMKTGQAKYFVIQKQNNSNKSLSTNLTDKQFSSYKAYVSREKLNKKCINKRKRMTVKVIKML